MNLRRISLTRLFTRGKRTTGVHPERVDEMHIPAPSFGLVPEQKREQDPADEFLAETSRSACERSSAGMTAFVP